MKNVQDRCRHLSAKTRKSGVGSFPHPTHRHVSFDQAMGRAEPRPAPFAVTFCQTPLFCLAAPGGGVGATAGGIGLGAAGGAATTGDWFSPNFCWPITSFLSFKVNSHCSYLLSLRMVMRCTWILLLSAPLPISFATCTVLPFGVVSATTSLSSTLSTTSSNDVFFPVISSKK